MTERMKAEEYRAYQRKGKGQPRVRGAVRTRVGDRKFDSALEAARYGDLCLLQMAGQIADLQCQVRIALIGADGPILTETGKQMHYVADFTYRDVASGLEVIEDAKGFRTEQYRMKRAVLAAMGMEIREIARPNKRAGK